MSVSVALECLNTLNSRCNHNDYKYNRHVEVNIHKSGNSVGLNWFFHDLYSNSDFCFYYFYSRFLPRAQFHSLLQRDRLQC